MESYSRVCIRDFTMTDGIGQRLELKRGKEYLTSASDEDDRVMVFTRFWVMVPRKIFAGAKRFT